MPNVSYEGSNGAAVSRLDAAPCDVRREKREEGGGESGGEEYDDEVKVVIRERDARGLSGSIALEWSFAVKVSELGTSLAQTEKILPFLVPNGENVGLWGSNEPNWRDINVNDLAISFFAFGPFLCSVWHFWGKHLTQHDPATLPQPRSTCSG